jgi:hypothetical protein
VSLTHQVFPTTNHFFCGFPFRFRNIKAGKPFDKDAISGDYSLQLMIGYENYVTWNSRKISEEIPEYVKRPGVMSLRAGPVMTYEQRLV